MIKSVTQLFLSFWLRIAGQNGDRQQNDKITSSALVNNGLNPKQSNRMQIFVRILAAETVALMVNQSDTILSVKEQIANRKNIPVQKQRLIYDGKQLEDESTLSNCHIQKESTLQLVLRVQFGPQFYIHIIKSDDKKVTMKVSPFDLIETIKKNIHAELGIPTNCQHLIFGGEHLENRRQLQEYHIRHDSALYVTSNHNNNSDDNDIKDSEQFVVPKKKSKESVNSTE